MRDLADNFVVICSIENLDPMGVHTGDSITVAPAQTLTDREYQRLRDMSARIIRRVGVETGGSNIQFAVNPEDGRVMVIEMNPRVSRSSALASKATGFPIAKIAAKLAVGYTLDEIPNDITRETPASFEPTIDYVVVKMPRWAFEKFPGADPTLGTQMKSVGEAMAIGRTFQEALQKGTALARDRPLWPGRGRPGQDRARAAARAADHAAPGAHLLPALCPADRHVGRAGRGADAHRSLVPGRDRAVWSTWKGACAPLTWTRLPRELLWQAKRAGFSDVQIAHLCAVSTVQRRAAERSRA